MCGQFWPNVIKWMFEICAVLFAWFFVWSQLYNGSMCDYVQKEQTEVLVCGVSLNMSKKSPVKESFPFIGGVPLVQKYFCLASVVPLPLGCTVFNNGLDTLAMMS